MLIIITGAPGSGKTTLAKKLSSDLKIPFISKDSIKERLFDTIGFHSREEKVALGIASLDIVHQVTENILVTGGNVIIENNYEYATKNKLIKLLRNTGTKALTVLVDCETTVLVERINRRDASPERHRGHVVNSSYPEPPEQKEPPALLLAEKYEEAIKTRGFRNFPIDGKRIIVDTTDFAKFCYEELLREVQSFIDEND